MQLLSSKICAKTAYAATRTGGFNSFLHANMINRIFSYNGICLFNVIVQIKI